MTTRDVGDISTNPGGRSGADWTKDARESLKAVWALNGGLLLGVAGTNVLTATVAVPEGFTAYSDGLRCTFIPAATTNSAVTINIQGVGAKAIRNPDGAVLGAGDIVAGRLTEIVFVAAADHFRLATSGGTTNVTVQGGIMVQRSAPSRLVAAAGPGTTPFTVATQNFQCAYANSRAIVEGTVSLVTGAGSVNDAGVGLALFVDDVLQQSFTDYCLAAAHWTIPVYFAHLPGNTDSHKYEIKVSSTISATYPKGSNAIWCSEIGPNA